MSLPIPLNRIWLPLILLLAACMARPVVAAPDAAASPTLKKARRLVQELGNPAYPKRERAGDQLIKLGLAALPALEEADRNPDPEIRYNAARLRVFIREVDFQRRLESFAARGDAGEQYDLPGWDRFRKLVGDSDHARQLFVAMQREDTELLRALEINGEAAKEALEQRTQDYRQLTLDGGAALPLGWIAAAIFVASQPEVETNNLITAHVFTLCFQPAFASGMTAEPTRQPLQKLLGSWVARSDEQGLSPALMLALRYDLTEGLEIAERTVADEQSPPLARQFAVLIIAKLGDQRHVPLLESLLDDRTYFSGHRINDVQYETEICDIALAALIHIRGEVLSDYGLDHVQPHPQYLFEPETIGFPNDAARNRALRKWAESQRK